MKKIVFFLATVFFLSSTMILTAQTEADKKVIESRGTKVENTRGDNPNILEAKPVNDNVVAPKPEQSAARTDYCKVIIDNWSGYAVDIYVDGYYEGTVAAWSEGYTYTVSGQTKLYGLSVGGTLEWGPKWVDCGYSYTWKLTN